MGLLRASSASTHGTGHPAEGTTPCGLQRPASLSLLDLVRRKLVLPSLCATSKAGAIEALLDLVIAEGELPARRRDQVAEAVFARERARSTGLGDGVALPHGVTDAVEDHLAAIGIAPAGIPFESRDGRPAELVVLILTPALRAATHVRALAPIARLARCADTRRSLTACRDRASALEVLARLL